MTPQQLRDAACQEREFAAECVMHENWLRDRRVEAVTLTGVLSNASLPPMTRDKVEAMERAR